MRVQEGCFVIQRYPITLDDLNTFGTRVVEETLHVSNNLRARGIDFLEVRKNVRNTCFTYSNGMVSCFTSFTFSSKSSWKPVTDDGFIVRLNECINTAHIQFANRG